MPSPARRRPKTGYGAGRQEALLDETMDLMDAIAAELSSDHDDGEAEVSYGDDDEQYGRGGGGGYGGRGGYGGGGYGGRGGYGGYY